jgi:hypothetical protein
MPAVTVEDVQIAVRVREHDEMGAERLDPVWLAVQVILNRAKAVPAARIAVGQGAGVDLANTGSLGSHDASNFVSF